MAAAERDRLGVPLLLGFAVASAGGPLAIAALYAPGAAHLPPERLPVAMAVGTVLFAAPLAVWADFAREVASAGGLYAFVRTAAGRGLAWAQGLLWTVSYLLYLPYTVTYILYYLLPDVLPVTRPVLAAAEVALPIALVLLVVFGGRAPFWVLAAAAAVQLLAVAALGAWTFALPATPRPAAPGPGAGALLAGGAQLSLLFVCLSLVLFLGGEAAGGRAALRRALLAGFGLAAAAALFAALALGRALTPGMAAADLPGVALAARHAGRPLAVAVGLLTLTSVAALIVAEYLALARLWQAMAGVPRTEAAAAAGALFVLGDLLSLLGPRRSYTLLLTPSLVALYASQALVFGAYAVWRGGWRPRTPLRVALAMVATAWAAYGAYLALVPGAQG